MSPRLRRHLDPDPVCLHNTECPGTHSIPCQDIKTSIPVQFVVVLAQVEEDGMEYRIPHGDELMKQLCLEGGGSRSSPRSKSMQSFMDIYGRKYLVIDDVVYCLPQDLQQANPSEVSASPLGYHHHRLPGTRRR